MKIVPGILESNFETILSKMDSIFPGSETIQIDVCDGEYVESRTWPHVEPAISRELATAELQKRKQAGQAVEFDLMIQNPEKTLFNWLSMNPSHIWIHFGSTNNLTHCFSLMRGYQMDYPKFTYGIAVTNTTPVDSYSKYIRMIDSIQVMGIAQVGKQGESFEEATFDTIASIQAIDPEIPIQVDGGVSDVVLSRLKSVGITNAVCGSAVFGGPEPLESLQRLQSLVE